MADIHQFPVDMVNHPPHYTQGAVECIDAVRAALGDSEFLGYCNGCAIKYLWRWRSKGGSEDLRKARFYIERMLDVTSEIEDISKRRVDEVSGYLQQFCDNLHD